MMIPTNKPINLRGNVKGLLIIHTIELDSKLKVKLGASLPKKRVMSYTLFYVSSKGRSVRRISLQELREDACTTAGVCMQTAGGYMQTKVRKCTDNGCGCAV